MDFIFFLLSWTHDEMAVIVTNKSDRGQMNSYIKNGEWFLKGFLF